MERVLTYQIPKDDSGKSVHEFLRGLGYSRHILLSMKPDPAAVMKNGAPVRMSGLLQEGDVLRITVRDESSSENIIPAPVPFDIVFEDSDLLVISKPSGVAIHPAVSHPANTLANGIALYFKEQGIPYVFRCINRLDRDTTGLLIAAKNKVSASILERDLRLREIHRTYLAIAEGLLPEKGTVNAPVGRKNSSLIERCVDWENGDTAVTHFRRLRYFPLCALPDTGEEEIPLSGFRPAAAPAQGKADLPMLSLAELHLETGRTHQIRVHMAHIGHPLLGDTLYNPEGLPGISRQALHSWKLDFIHPITKEQMHFESPLPADMEAVVNVPCQRNLKR